MKLYEAIFFGLLTYAGCAGGLWFGVQGLLSLPPELQNPTLGRYRPLIYFNRLSHWGRVSVVCQGLSFLVMIGGMCLLFGLAISIPFPNARTAGVAERAVPAGDPVYASPKTWTMGARH